MNFVREIHFPEFEHVTARQMLRAQLRPVTPAHSTRYDNDKVFKVEMSSKSIPVCMYSSTSEPEPEYLPEGWQPCVHPEGQKYFYNTKWRIVTDSYIYDMNVCNKLSNWIITIFGIIKVEEIHLPENYELFLCLEEDEDGCQYYFVDHDTRTEFWIHEINTNELCIAETSSMDHFRLALEEHYWTHLEYFPSHHKSVSSQVTRGLMHILTQGLADHLTSSTSTFPYSASQCSKFIDMLQKNGMLNHEFVYDANKECAVWILARIWSQIARSRFINFHGEPHARLSRDRSIMNIETEVKSYTNSIISGFLLGEPIFYNSELKKLWVDGYVYIEHWNDFVSVCRGQWKEAFIGLSAFAILHMMLCIPNFIGSQTLALFSMALSSPGLIISLALLQRPVHNANNLCASQVANFLTSVTQPRTGLQALAIIYAVPKALFHWSVVIFSLQIYLAMLQQMGLNTTAILFLIPFGLAILAAFYVKSRFSKSRVWWRSVFKFSDKRTEDCENLSDAAATTKY